MEEKKNMTEGNDNQMTAEQKAKKLKKQIRYFEEVGA